MTEQNSILQGEIMNEWQLITEIRGNFIWRTTRDYRAVYSITQEHRFPMGDDPIYTSLEQVHIVTKRERQNSPITPDTAQKILAKIIDTNDCETGHIRADDFLLDLLECLGYDLKLTFKCGTFYYS